jgi:hypothetical protein
MPDEPKIPTHVTLNAEGRVAEDLACIQCGYNLRTLQREARCPECATAVGRSMLGNRLQYSNTAWLAGVSWGLTLIVGMLFLSVLCLVVTSLAGLIGNAVGGRTQIIIFTVIRTAWWLTLLIVAAGSLGGIWSFTKREPNRRAGSRGLSLCTLIRSCACIAVVAPTVSWSLHAHKFVQLIAFAFGESGVFAVLCGCVAMLVHVRRLARRIPSEKEVLLRISCLIHGLAGPV